MSSNKLRLAVLGALLTVGVFAGFAAWHPSASAEEDHAKLFKIRCSNCHGVDGRGQTTLGKQLEVKDWKAGKTLKALSDDQIRKLVAEGTKAPDGKERMPAFKTLTSDQITSLIMHVRSFQ